MGSCITLQCCCKKIYLLRRNMCRWFRRPVCIFLHFRGSAVPLICLNLQRNNTHYCAATHAHSTTSNNLFTINQSHNNRNENLNCWFLGTKFYTQNCIKGTLRRRLTYIFSRSIKSLIYHIFTYEVWTLNFYRKGQLYEVSFWRCEIPNSASRSHRPLGGDFIYLHCQPVVACWLCSVH